LQNRRRPIPNGARTTCSRRGSIRSSTRATSWSGSPRRPARLAAPRRQARRLLCALWRFCLLGPPDRRSTPL